MSVNQISSLESHRDSFISIESDNPYKSINLKPTVMSNPWILIV